MAEQTTTKPVKRARNIRVIEDERDVPLPGPAEGSTNPISKAPDLALVAGGVSAAWLGHVFGMDKNTVKKRLAKCPVAGMNRSTPHYLIPVAAAYLVNPKVDIEEYIRSVRAQDLPAHLNDTYWSALGKRQKVLADAGDTWDTADVLAVFGRANIQIKSTVQLWVDEVERVQGLTDEQRAMLIRMSDGLLEDIHEIYVTEPEKCRTRSTIKEYDEATIQDDLI